jgi:gliding motility-associated-like protein
VAVNVFSLATPAITNVNRLCNFAKPVQIQVSPVGGLFGGLNTTAVSSKGVFNPANAIIGNNIINYSITSGPCVAYGQTTIVIEKFVSAEFVKMPYSPYGAFCQGISEPFNLNQFVANPGGQWFSNGGGIVNGSQFDPAKATVGLNANIITYSTASYPTATLCPDTRTIAITVGNIPTVTAIASVLNNCAPVQVKFNVVGADKGSAIWTFGDGAETSQEFIASHVYNNPGSYTAALSYFSELGCPAAPVSANPAFFVNEKPVPDFNMPDEVLISDSKVQFTNLTASVNNNRYRWKFEGLYEDNNINPEVTFPKAGRYAITLVAENPNGCKAEVTKSLEVKNDFNIFIPSSFSPNFDGLNDVFAPVFSAYGLDFKNFEMEIFDRWGHSLFKSKDPNKGWDGTVNNKGEPLKEEVYVYKIKYKDLEGNLYNKIGHVSLLK